MLKKIFLRTVSMKTNMRFNVGNDICRRQTLYAVLLVTAVVTLALFYYLLPQTTYVPKATPCATPSATPCVNSCEHLSVQLNKVIQELQKLHMEGLPLTNSSLRTIRKLLKDMQPESFQLSTVAEPLTTPTSQPVVVCPEVYINRTFGVPYYENEKGWITLPCKAPPIEKVVSIVLNPLSQKNCSENLDWILKGINQHYPSISVYIATKLGCEADTTENYPNVHRVPVAPNSTAGVTVPVSSSLTSGETWMNLISNVKTPYVLIARDLFHFTNFSRLERLIRVISNDIHIAVAGGSTRNLSGHWNIGCFQTKMHNYILDYTEGYYQSKNECMFCDYVSGPFMARTSIFEQVTLDKKLPENILFHDFFLELKNASYKAVNCPDSMNFARNVDSAVKASKEAWVPLARKWELNLIQLPKGVKHVLTCKESGLTCSRGRTKAYLIPICCRKEYLNYLKTLAGTGLPYELRDGDVLAAVKMRGSIPWDTDTDMNVETTGKKLWEKTKARLKEIDFKSVDYGDWLSVRVPNTNINMDPISKLSSAVLLPKELEVLPTLVEYDGDWLVGPVSPGLYARNGYGVEILRHVQSYSIYGHSDPYEAYKSGYFLPCPKPHHHACLDHFSIDGNIQFMIP